MKSVLKLMNTPIPGEIWVRHNWVSSYEIKILRIDRDYVIAEKINKESEDKMIRISKNLFTQYFKLP